ncbi:MAG: hypothetical protein IPP60_12470 [Sphingobacteriales bacterium]|nr:hypothetical protein [Sphingobacteriales bacterium]
MRGIFLDDERYPKDVTWIKYPENVEWFVVRNSSEFTDQFWQLMRTGEEYIVSFDHDIQEFIGKIELTGYSNLKGMLNAIQYYGSAAPKCYFHSMNPVGKENMEAYYNNFVDFYNKEWEK